VIYKLLRPAVFTLDAERAHRLTIQSLKLSPLRGPQDAGQLAVDVAGLRYPNPLGMAAGFDKDGEVPDAVLGLGFGFTEIGSLTPRPQAGNPKPRLFRLSRDRAVINRMGFNNGGLPAALPRLEKRQGKPGIVGINIGANKDSGDRIADYAVMARAVAPYASYLAINVSSPNTPGLRALQDPQALGALIDGVKDAAGEEAPPVFLKVAPDLKPVDIDDIARLAIAKKLGALIVSNTTIARPDLKSRAAGEAGGLSGAPLRDLALQRVRDFRKATGGAVPLVGVGGISNAEDAWARIRAGASLIQLYSAMVYEGPGLARRIVGGLERLMEREGFSSIAEAVGTE
jgi:dihydroorotate dehydrogenase